MEQAADFHCAFQITELNGTFDEPDREVVPREYLVEEPESYDYIFEPDHYPHFQEVSELASDTVIPKTSMNSEEKYQNGVKILKRVARVVSENDGILEYEYNSRADIKASLEDDDDEFFNNYFNDFDYKHYHLNAVIRSISLSKCPGISGFGFKLDRHSQNGEDLFYVNEITTDTPAELCLRLGDILIELDEKNPCECFKSIDECHDYLTRKDNVNMMVIHESKYMSLKSKDEDLIRSHCINCEDMVIVTWNNQFETNLIQ